MGKPEGVSWYTHLQWYKKFRKWSEDIRNRPISLESEGWCTAIILNYKRPQNIELLVRTALLTSGIAKVIVSNNNPSCHLERWLRLRHPRLQLLYPPDRRGTGERFGIAAGEPSEFFIAIDDDIFLRPKQLQILCEELRRKPEIPHGIFGEIMKENGVVQHAVHGFDGELDILNRVYAFTFEHVALFFQLVQGLNITAEQIRRESYFDDILLSFCGSTRPQCHNVGTYLDCATQGKKGIAAWREEQFTRQRALAYQLLCVIQPRAK